MENHSFQGLSENQDKTKALSSEILVDAENNDDELSKEDEEELAFLTKNVQRFLRRRK